MAHTLPQAVAAATVQDGIAHGTRQGYKKSGCRCKDCKAANAAYEKDRYHAAKAKKAAQVSEGQPQVIFF